MNIEDEKRADIMVGMAVEEIARMNSTELFDFIRLLAYKWPTLADQICQKLNATLSNQKEHEYE
tara:strand:+ start:415 stop:606 length:192 start_codon:yes stop_codon:yes gene_type:complete